MINQFSYKHYSHHIGSGFYDEFVRKDVPPTDLMDKIDSASFLLSDYYPVLLDLKKENVHYNTYNSCTKDGTLKEDFFRRYDKEIRNSFHNGFDFLVFVDEELVGNNVFTYHEYWCEQPISMVTRASSYMYITLSFAFHQGVIYYTYPIRTVIGSTFLEAYHGRYLSENGSFSELGLQVLANIVKLNYASPYMGVHGLKQHLAKDMPEDMKSYKIKTFMEKGEEYL